RQKLLQQIDENDPPPLRTLDRSIPVELDTIVRTALEKEPRERYATAKALAEDLRRFLQHVPIRARRATSWDRLKKWRRRNHSLVRVITWSTSAVILFAGVAMSLVWRHRQEALLERSERQKHESLSQLRDVTIKQNNYARIIELADQFRRQADFEKTKELLARCVPRS